MNRSLAWLDDVKFDANGLIPVIAQDHISHKILMVAWMNQESLQETVHSQRAVYWSRSRQRLWRKGEESGHIQHVHDIYLDCDGDVILLMIDQVGHIACHTGRESCFFRQLQHSTSDTPTWETVAPVLKDPEHIYR
ncbi:phosphoribosyl-AMP cyclohydrolase [Alcaligenes endophyticus]|uniref:Phosphoribosyl-AMP cyclohydrolase n=1 Tax=Alcaligenes endophyticus TaxID=1929088 RepID=A0ABT8EFB7_9BURK|nr:phosphoribosyl-AMP cyclohydrolase [Alcaligenes endophyticus]MCX5590367.1 phosphoribosyl-AMP cyclohydrolase [Alcaligenes endophyticus]MDN4119969.1 phosphoribosyl-AMP cyclohydrolase [Alcaligenes endophyticus]